MKRPPRNPVKDKLVNERYCNCGWEAKDLVSISLSDGMAFVRAKKMILLSFNRIPQINWEINNHNNNNISPRLCASVLVCVCVWKRESVGTDVQSKIRKEMMQKENHRSGQCWCMAPPSCLTLPTSFCSFCFGWSRGKVQNGWLYSGSSLLADSPYLVFLLLFWLV